MLDRYHVSKKAIQSSNTSLEQPLNHAEGKTHSDIATAVFGETQKHLGTGDQTAVSSDKRGSPEQSNSGACVLQPSQVGKVATAEILWALKVAQSNYSYASSDGTTEIFRMFPGETAEHFTMSRIKISYLLSDELRPYYRKEVCNFICEAGIPYTLQYDETSNSQNCRQYDLLIRFWCPDNDQVCIMLSLMFVHAPGKDVAQVILDARLEDWYNYPWCSSSALDQMAQMSILP